MGLGVCVEDEGGGDEVEGRGGGNSMRVKDRGYEDGMEWAVGPMEEGVGWGGGGI